MPHPSSTFLQLDFRGAIHLGFLEIMFAFLFVDLFDNVGTLVGVCEQGGFIKDGKIPRVGRALLADATGTIFGSLAGTSTVTSYIESVAGIAAGARTGLSNVFVAALFVLAMFCSPLATAIPGYATAPALILVGALMTQSIAHIDWADFSEAVPAFITMLATPLTFSIATGLSLGLISYTVVKIAVGKDSRNQPADLDPHRPVHPALHLSCDRVAVGTRSRSTSKAADKSVCPTALMRQLPAIARNFPIFAGANQQDADRRTWIGDVLVRRRFRILLQIKFHAGVLKVLASCCSHFGVSSLPLLP